MEKRAKPSGSVKKHQKAKLDHTCVRKLDHKKETENIQKALSIAPILQEIFRNLSINDLKACGKVNITWESEADYSMRQINIEFFSTNTSIKEGINVQEITGVLRDTHTKKLTDLSNLVSIITRAMNKRTICQPHIALRLNQCKINNRELIKFLDIFGHLVFRLNYSQNKYGNPREFCQFLWKHLPNLVELHMDDFLLGAENERVIPQEDQKYLKALKTISFFKGYPNYPERFRSPDDSFLLILNMAPNLQIIESFPLDKAHLLPFTGKINLVRSFQIPDKEYRPAGRYIKLWLENLSSIAPQLSKFKFPSTSHEIFQLSIKYITRILESSRQSLEHLVIFPTQGYDYIQYPFRFPGVRVLEFANQKRDGYDPYVVTTQWRGFFHPEVDLRQKFPTLQEIKISLKEIDIHDVHEYFPSETFQKLKVPRLHLNKKAALCLVYLCNVFGSVDHLTIDITKMKIQGLKSIIHDISRFPNLKCLRFEINSHYFFYDDGDSKVSQEMGIFDSVLTGIPEHICKKLRDPKNFEDVNDSGTDVSLLRIQGLTNLEFIFTNKLSRTRSGWTDYFPVSLFSSVSYLYGLMMYPHVQVAVRVEDEHPKIHTDKMIKAVDDILDEIELDMSYKTSF